MRLYRLRDKRGRMGLRDDKGRFYRPECFKRSSGVMRFSAESRAYPDCEHCEVGSKRPPDCPLTAENMSIYIDGKGHRHNLYSPFVAEDRARNRIRVDEENRKLGVYTGQRMG